MQAGRTFKRCKASWFHGRLAMRCASWYDHSTAGASVNAPSAPSSLNKKSNSLNCAWGGSVTADNVKQTHVVAAERPKRHFGWMPQQIRMVSAVASDLGLVVQDGVDVLLLGA